MPRYSAAMIVMPSLMTNRRKKSMNSARTLFHMAARWCSCPDDTTTTRYSDNTIQPDQSSLHTCITIHNTHILKYIYAIIVGSSTYCKNYLKNLQSYNSELETSTSCTLSVPSILHWKCKVRLRVLLDVLEKLHIN